MARQPAWQTSDLTSWLRVISLRFQTKRRVRAWSIGGLPAWSRRITAPYLISWLSLSNEFVTSFIMLTR
jgi:hypothetical protein